MGDRDDDELDRILTDVYACTRDWSAWDLRTMTDADFTPAAETDLRADLIAWRDAAVQTTGPKPFRIRIGPTHLATVDRPASLADRFADTVVDTNGNWWHVALPAPKATCSNCGAVLTWAWDTSAWARADEPERGREICRHPDGTWKPHVVAGDAATAAGGKGN